MNNEYPPLYVSVIRLYNSYILSPGDSFESVASSLFGIQSQIFNASAIAFALRTKEQSFSQFKQSLKMLSLVRLWGIRTTIHIYNRKDWNILLSYLTIGNNWYRKKMSTSEVDIDSLIDKAKAIIDNVDYFDKNFLIRNGISKEHLGPWGDLLIELNNRGYIFHGSNFQNKRNKFYGNTQVVLGRVIKNTKRLVDVKREITSKFFEAYSPATIHDFAHWLGITVRESDEYFQLIKNELLPIKCGNMEYFIKRTNQKKFDQIFRKHSADTICYLLPKFDPLLLAYYDKTWIGEKPFHNRIWKIAGHVEGVVLQYGKAIATWRYLLTSRAIKFEISPFRTKFSKRNIEKDFIRIANFFERPIGSIVLTKEFL